MRLFSRFLVVVLILGGLAYGSYAFGKYVLSSRIFGPGATRQASGPGSDSDSIETVTQNDAVRGEPRVKVHVLPADSAGDQPSPPDSVDQGDTGTVPRHRHPNTSSAPDSDLTVTPTPGIPTPTPAGGLNPEVTIRPVRRVHKRKHRHVQTPADTGGTSSGVNATTGAAPVARDDQGTVGSSTSNSVVGSPPAGQTSNPGDGNSGATAPSDAATATVVHHHRHHRERVHPESSAPVPSPSHPSRPTHSEDPIPRPEGDGGSGSSGAGNADPVPVPE